MKIFNRIFTILCIGMISNTVMAADATNMRDRLMGNSGGGSSSRSIIETVPGTGVDPIRIGDSSATVVRKLGRQEAKVSFQKEYKRWVDYGYDTRKELPFFIGFDFLYEYSAGSNRTDTPIWKIYFKNDKVVYVALTRFSYDDSSVRRTGISKTCLFYAPVSNVEKCLGRNYFYYLDEANNKNYMYLEDGVNIIGVDNIISTIAIHRPLSRSEVKEFKSYYNK